MNSNNTFQSSNAVYSLHSLVRNMSFPLIFFLMFRVLWVEASPIFDPYIICNDLAPVPPPPPGHQPFPNHLSLCAAVYGEPGMSMGCFCDHPYGTVRCVEDLGNPYLWSASTILVDEETHRRTWITLHDLCVYSCYCSSAAKGKAARNETIRSQKLHEISPSATAFENGGAADGIPTSAASSSSSDSGERSNMGSSLQSPDQMACGSSCTRSMDCPVDSTGCTCRTRSETSVMGQGVVAFRASCIINLGGKREENSPCPCNSTYVSHACCGSESGMVWEETSLKLGELMEESIS